MSGYITVAAADGTKIPVLASVVSSNAVITVEGDGSCRLNGMDGYLVTIVNSSKGKPLSDKVIDKGKDAAKDKAVDLVKEQVVPAVLRAIGLKTVATYVVRSLEFLSTTPVKLATAIFTDATDIGEAKEGYYRQPLPDGESAIIRWIGEPSES